MMTVLDDSSTERIDRVSDGTTDGTTDGGGDAEEGAEKDGIR
jgi:hypothetical protein